ncbi:protein of unknown function [Streptantibioticus cattleyicolor NRRL 8057 = DSM 46488]|nr:protein of unknown function [Streptantibioticus cattleyicolor NRRL 8057 = DSM 46488]
MVTAIGPRTHPRGPSPFRPVASSGAEAEIRGEDEGRVRCAVRSDLDPALQPGPVALQTVAFEHLPAMQVHPQPLRAPAVPAGSFGLRVEDAAVGGHLGQRLHDGPPAVRRLLVCRTRYGPHLDGPLQAGQLRPPSQPVPPQVVQFVSTEVRKTSLISRMNLIVLSSCAGEERRGGRLVRSRRSWTRWCPRPRVPQPGPGTAMAEAGGRCPTLRVIP